MGEANILIASSQCGLEAGKKIKKLNGKFICDRGSAHILYQNETLKEEYRKNQKTEQEFLDEINNKYGDGSLNPETGVFTPTLTENP